MCCAGFDLLEGEAHALELLIGRQKYSFLEKIQQVLWTDQRFVLSYSSALFLQVVKIFVFCCCFPKSSRSWDWFSASFGIFEPLRIHICKMECILFAREKTLYSINQEKTSRKLKTCNLRNFAWQILIWKNPASHYYVWTKSSSDKRRIFFRPTWWVNICILSSSNKYN